MGEEQMTRDAGMAVREGETAREQAQAQTPEPTPVRVQMPEQTAVSGQMTGQTQADAAKQEQEVSDNGEDMLLEQIDAFRDKAKQLQNLISAKERKVKELEALVRAKEEKNQALREQNVRLQEELNKKKAKADGLVTDVESQVDRMLQSLQGEFSGMQQKIQHQVQYTQEQASERTRKVEDSLVTAREDMQQINSGVERLHSGVSQIGESVASIHTDVTGISSDFGEVREDLSKVNTGMESMQKDLFDKIHNENVKVYRNLQDLLQEMDHSQAQEQESEYKFRKMRRGLSVVTVFSVINLAALEVVLLNLFGIL